MNAETIIMWLWLAFVFFVIFYKLCRIEKVMEVLVDGRRPPKTRAG